MPRGNGWLVYGTRGRQMLPSAPLVEWLREEHDQLYATMDYWERNEIRRHGEAGYEHQYPAIGLLADKYDTCTRVMYRYLRGQQGGGSTGTFDVDAYERETVENLLSRGGVHLLAVYPDADVYLKDPEPYAVCVKCAEVDPRFGQVTPIAGICPFCETQLTKAPDTVQYGRVTRYELREAVLRHRNGESFSSLAQWLVDKRKRGRRIQFRSVDAARQTLSREFQFEGVTVRGARRYQ